MVHILARNYNTKKCHLIMYSWYDQQTISSHGKNKIHHFIFWVNSILITQYIINYRVCEDENSNIKVIEHTMSTIKSLYSYYYSLYLWRCSVRVVKEADLKSAGVSLAGSNPVCTVRCIQIWFLFSFTLLYFF